MASPSQTGQLATVQVMPYLNHTGAAGLWPHFCLRLAPGNPSAKALSAHPSCGGLGGTVSNRPAFQLFFRAEALALRREEGQGSMLHQSLTGKDTGQVKLHQGERRRPFVIWGALKR